MRYFKCRGCGKFFDEINKDTIVNNSIMDIELGNLGLVFCNIDCANQYDPNNDKGD